MTDRPSLVSRPSHTLATCAHCGSNRITELWMTLADGSRVKLASCHLCEVKTWKDGDTVLTLSEVLTRARKQS